MWVRSNKGNVFIGNLPPDFSDERLAETFDPYGIVLSAAVARDPATGARLRYGFVDIASERAMTKAIRALDGTEVDGCKLNVKPRERPQPKPGMAPRAGAARSGAAKGPGRPRVAEGPRGAARPAFAAAPPVGESGARGQSEAAAGHAAISQSAQSQRALEGLPEIEPPPRRDFEVVRRPLRRGTPSFQVERRPLPRRV